MIATVDRPPRLPTNRELGVIADLKRTVSASRLNCWQTCRLKFYFRYVLQIKRAQSAAQYVGSIDTELVLAPFCQLRQRFQRHKEFNCGTSLKAFELVGGKGIQVGHLQSHLTGTVTIDPDRMQNGQSA